MGKRVVLLFALFLPLSAACSGPPNFKVPDRPPSFEGVITAVRAADASSGTIDVAIGESTSATQSVQPISVANGTLILQPGTTYPQTFDRLVPQKRIRVWLDTNSSLSMAVPRAQVIALEPFRPPDRPPSIEGVITAVQPGNGDPWRIDVAAGGQVSNTLSTRRVTVNNDTRLLKAVTGEFLYVGDLVPQRRVRVWLPTNTLPSTVEPVAEVIEFLE